MRVAPARHRPAAGAEVWAAASPAWVAEEWGRLLAFVAAHGTPVARPGPATELCQRLWLAGGAPVVQRREVGAALLRCRLGLEGPGGLAPPGDQQGDRPTCHRPTRDGGQPPPIQTCNSNLTHMN